MSATKTKGTIKIVYLYPNEMNIYGDWGNVLTLSKRLEWHGYTPEIIQHHIGSSLPKDSDIIIGGGGQDSSQKVVEADLLKNQQKIHALANDNVPMLVVCGLYQLFGKKFTTSDNSVIEGIGLFNFETFGSAKRLVGNITVETPFGEVIGYENHSGKTILDASQPAFGTVKRGNGNNGNDKTEGAVFKNAYGTYMHGSVLPKNPAFADALIQKAVERKFGEFEPNIIDDSFAEKARMVAKRRPR